MSGDTARYRPLRDYGLVGDCHTAALISVDGSVDWLCAPRFDSPSLFARLLDAERGGHFAVQPVDPFTSGAAYVGDSGVLRTTFRTSRGVATLTDFMPVGPGSGRRPFAQVEALHHLVRLVEGQEGEVAMAIDFRPRPHYGATVPSLRARAGGVAVEAGDRYQVRLCASVPLVVAGPAARGHTVVRGGERVALVLDLSGAETAATPDPARAARGLKDTLAFWAAWAAACQYRGPYEGAVMRSAVTLKLLTYAPTGAMVAAPTTSLPEEIGGVRNWDYRYTWIRDASFALYALSLAGHIEDGERFMEWACNRALQCRADLQTMYGVDGERELPERILEHLEGYCGSRPVRVGNAAYRQLQLDVYGELLNCYHTCRRLGTLLPDEVRAYWPTFGSLVDVVAANWRRADSGIWEVRSRPEHFVYSRAMAWVALDRGIRAAEELGLAADLDRWRQTRRAIEAEVLERGYDPELGAFARSYEVRALDAANLLLPLLGFIDARDPRMAGTIEAIERSLVVDGLVYRYRDAPDGVPGGEGAFAPCTFWLVGSLTAQGRLEEATALFEAMLTRATPLGLYAEEIDPATGNHLGNFPQALTHLGLINAAINLGRAGAAEAASRG